MSVYRVKIGLLYMDKRYQITKWLLLQHMQKDGDAYVMVCGELWHLKLGKMYASPKISAHHNDPCKSFWGNWLTLLKQHIILVLLVTLGFPRLQSYSPWVNDANWESYRWKTIVRIKCNIIMIGLIWGKLNNEIIYSK